MIREAFLLVVLLSFGFSAECGGWNENNSCVLWNDPPIATMVGNNVGASAGLMHNAALLSGAEIDIENLAAVDIRVLGALPMVDYRMPSNASGILWSWGEKSANNTIINTQSGNCTHRYVFEVPEYGIWDYNWSAEITFTFRDEERSSILINESFLDGVGVEPQAIIPIPFSEEELEAANGTETMSVRIEWEFYYYFKYLNDPGGSCEATSEVKLEGVTVTGSHEMEFIVESGEPEFFTVRPALGEQWYVSSHFDNFVLSRKSIYKAEVEKEGEGVAQARVKNFTLVHSNEAGLENVWYIFSHNATDFENASMGAYEVAYWAGPVSGSSLPFSHLYEVNHSYGEEWGQHLMGIRVYDFYGGEYEYSKEALGRKVTKEGVSETGEEGEDPLYYRPGIESGGEAGLTRFTIPASTTLVVFMVFSLWAYAYYRRERGKRRA